MDRETGIRNLAQKKHMKRINRDLMIFTFFLFLSFLFWYLNSLSKVLNTHIKYPVSYVNIPGNISPGKEFPAKFSLLLNGPGYSILKLKLSSNGNPLLVDFAETGYEGSLKTGTGENYIVTANLINRFNDKLKSDSRILSVKPDTLFFTVKQDDEEIRN
jgi:hypothetical protein